LKASVNSNDHVVDEGTGHAMQRTLGTFVVGTFDDERAIFDSDADGIIEGALQLALRALYTYAGAFDLHIHALRYFHWHATNS
jgi:hypothetical protein